MHTTNQPDAQIVRCDGAILSIRRDDGRMAQYNRDDVTTAYLLLLDRPRGEEDMAGVVVELMAEGLDHPEATRCVLAARLLLDHDIEP
jgi:hypothetical protein